MGMHVQLIGRAAFVCGMVCCVTSILADEIHVLPGASIQAAIDDALTGDEIIVHPGTYPEKINLHGKAITLRSLSGPADTIIANTDRAGSLITCNSNEGPDTVIDGFTITGGDHASGGGISLFHAGPTIRNCNLTGNRATYGGGIFCDLSAPTMVNCIFDDNQAEASGGGLYVLGAVDAQAPRLEECTFSNNRAGTVGAALRAWDSSIALLNCTFTSNHATYNGGALANGGTCAPQVVNCWFEGNRADTLFAPGDTYGGAIDNGEHVQGVIANSVFIANRADATLPSVSFGGAIANRGFADPRIVNCTMKGNLANVAGGVCNADNADADVANCILWDQTDEIVLRDAASISIRHSVVRSGWIGAGNINIDPMLEGINLPAGHPAIDGGDNTALPADALDLDQDGDLLEPLPLDYHGQPRRIDDPQAPDWGVGTPPLVDMGAAEFRPHCAGDVNDDATVNVEDFFALLQHWGACPTAPESCPWDLTGAAGSAPDGSVGVNDFFALLQHWGPCVSP
jgi:predicted outer membrane repeat protein